jgi:hypothetical protein
MTKEAFNKFHILFPYEKYNNGIMGESAWRNNELITNKTYLLILRKTFLSDDYRVTESFASEFEMI